MLSFELTGVAETVARLKGLQGKELERKSQNVLAKAVRAVVVPVVKAETPQAKRGSQVSPSGALRRKVSAHKIGLREGEVAAYSIRAREFIAPMVIKGTKAHLITARGMGAKFTGYVGRSGTLTGSQVTRSINRGGKALLLPGGQLVATVHHPGARPNPFIARAAARIDTNALAIELGKELTK